MDGKKWGEKESEKQIEQKQKSCKRHTKASEPWGSSHYNGDENRDKSCCNTTKSWRAFFDNHVQTWKKKSSGLLWVFLFPCKIQTVFCCGKVCTYEWFSWLLMCVWYMCTQQFRTRERAHVCVSPSPINQPVVRRSAGESVCVSQSFPRCLNLLSHSPTEEKKKKKLILTFRRRPSKAIDNYEIKWVIALRANWGMVIAHWGSYEFRSLWVIPPTLLPPPLWSSLRDERRIFVLSECKIKQNRAFFFCLLHTHIDSLPWSCLTHLLKNHMLAKHQVHWS